MITFEIPQDAKSAFNSHRGAIHDQIIRIANQRLGCKDAVSYGAPNTVMVNGKEITITKDKITDKSKHSSEPTHEETAVSEALHEIVASYQKEGHEYLSRLPKSSSSHNKELEAAFE